MEHTVVSKVFRLLETLGQVQQGQSLASLSASVEMAKPTVHRLLKMMAELGYVGRTDQGFYRLTTKLQQITMPTDDRGLVMAAEPTLWRLHEQTGETVNFGVLRNDRVLYLRVLESSQPLRRVAEPMSTQHFHCGALGRVLVANQDEQLRESILRRCAPFEKRTAATVVEVAELRSVLDAARRDGYAIEHDQTDVGVTCIGSGIFKESEIVAAVSVSVPSARCGKDQEAQLVRSVRAAAEQLSGKLSRRTEVA